MFKRATEMRSTASYRRVKLFMTSLLRLTVSSTKSDVTRSYIRVCTWAKK